MTTPTPAKFAEAVDLLLSAPGVTTAHTLADITAMLAPPALLAAALKALLVERDVDIRDAHFMDVATLLSDLAASQGLRITTDPGELVGHTAVVPINSDGGWMLDHGAGTYGSDDLDSIQSLVSRSDHQRVAALYLLPEGGKA